jgi:hypothetical protein
MAPMNVPKPWPGSETERLANRDSHHFDWAQAGDSRCWDCDARPTGVGADWPCGTIPPRMIIDVPDRRSRT